ncbi:MAG TPA: rRNA maturation RNase YbeY [Bacteroidetes bacterium]|nr:rRNA maturation RNase YbeY [Bacteroidota bacterium]
MSEKKKKSLSVLLPYLTSEISFNTVDTSYTVKHKKNLRSWIKETISKEKKSLGEISFNFCSDEYLLSVNKEHLNHDYYTDIITFDFCENDIISGDIYISIDRVKENAKTENRTINNELHRVIIHGILHLCGYKDKKPADASVMREKEDFYLSLLGE